MPDHREHHFEVDPNSDMSYALNILAQRYRQEFIKYNYFFFDTKLSETDTYSSKNIPIGGLIVARIDEEKIIRRKEDIYKDDNPLLTKMLELGFSKERSINALDLTSGNLEEAIKLIVNEHLAVEPLPNPIQAKDKYYSHVRSRLEYNPCSIISIISETFQLDEETAHEMSTDLLQTLVKYGIDPQNYPLEKVNLSIDYLFHYDEKKSPTNKPPADKVEENELKDIAKPLGAFEEVITQPTLDTNRRRAAPPPPPPATVDDSDSDDESNIRLVDGIPSIQQLRRQLTPEERESIAEIIRETGSDEETAIQIFLMNDRNLETTRAIVESMNA